MMTINRRVPNEVLLTFMFLYRKYSAVWPTLFFEKPSRFSKYLRKVVASWTSQKQIILDYILPKDVPCGARNDNGPGARDRAMNASPAAEKSERDMDDGVRPSADERSHRDEFPAPSIVQP